MSQHDWDELLSAYADGEVTPAERDAVEALLDSTPAARKALQETRALSQWLRSLPRDDAPPELRAAAMQAARSHPTPVAATASRRFRSYRREWLAGLSAMAMTVMVAGLLSLQFRPGSGPTTEFATWSDETAPAPAAARGPGRPLQRSALEALADTAMEEAPWREARLGRERGEAVRGAAPASTPAPMAAAAAGTDAAMESLAAKEEAPLPKLAELDGVTAEGRVDEVERLREVLPYLRLQDENGQVIGNVELVVIDAQRVANQFQVLLMKNGVQTVDVSTVDYDADVAAAQRALGAAQLEVGKPTSSNDLYAVYTEAPGEPLSKTLEELIQQREVLGMRLQPPLQVGQVVAQNEAATPPAEPTPGLERGLRLKQITDAYLVQKLDERFEEREADLPASALDALAAAEGEPASGYARQADAMNRLSLQSATVRNFSTSPAGNSATAVRGGGATTVQADSPQNQVFFNTLVKLPAPIPAEELVRSDLNYQTEMQQQVRRNAVTGPSPTPATADDLRQMRYRFAQSAPDTFRLLFVFQPAPAPGPAPATKSALPPGR
uniref:Putative zinc-finger domain-containing protein n=1 Tax=Schlesneria paludicola TaxID=360056 RepID=A0A7C2K0B0_9PLAN